MFPPALLLLQLALQRRSIPIALALRVRRRGAGAGTQPDRAAVLLRAVGGGGGRDRRPPSGRYAISRERAPVLARDRHRRRRAGRRAGAADHAVRRRCRTARTSCYERALEASLYPGQSGDAAGAEHFRLAPVPALGTVLRDRAGGRRGRRIVQLSVRRLGAGRAAALVRHRRRRAVAARPRADERGAGRRAALHARPLYAAVSAGRSTGCRA